MYDPRNRTMAAAAKHTRWKNCSKKTAQELLELNKRSDFLNAEQKKLLENRAKQSKKRKTNPSDRESGESMSDYLKRLGIVGVVVD